MSSGLRIASGCRTVPSHFHFKTAQQGGADHNAAHPPIGYQQISAAANDRHGDSFGFRCHQKPGEVVGTPGQDQGVRRATYPEAGMVCHRLVETELGIDVDFFKEFP